MYMKVCSFVTVSMMMRGSMRGVHSCGMALTRVRVKTA